MSEEPWLIAQRCYSTETSLTEDCRQWTEDVIQSLGTTPTTIPGVTIAPWFRVSWDATAKGTRVLLEVWKTRPEDDGPIRWPDLRGW